MPDRIVTPSGLPLYSAPEFAKAVQEKSTLPDSFAVIDAVQAEVKATKNDRRFKFRISTDGIDRDRDIISVAGWNLDHYKKNPVVLYAHDYRSLPVGKSLSISVGKSGLDAEMEFIDAEVYPFAETVRRMVQAGVLRAASVGFKPTKWMYNEERRGVDIDSAELLEWSIVPVPANAECLVQLSMVPLGVAVDFAKSCEEHLSVIKGKGQWVVGVEIGTMQDFVKAYNDADIPKLIKLLTAKNEDANSNEHPGYPGCKRAGGCPTNADGSPDNCTMADCPMKSQGGVGADSQASAEEDILAGIVAPVYPKDEIEGSFDDVDRILRQILTAGVVGPIRDCVREQLNYACGRVD